MGNENKKPKSKPMSAKAGIDELIKNKSLIKTYIEKSKL